MSVDNSPASPGAALVAEFQFEHAGETFTLTRPTIQSELEYTRHLESKTIQRIRVHAGLYGGELSKILAENNLLLASGVFEWGMPRWLESLNVTSNMQELSYLCVKQNVPGLTRDRWDTVFKANWADTPNGKTNQISQAVWELIASPNSASPGTGGQAPGKVNPSA